MNKLIIIFDVDGTLADIEHRRHYVRVRPANWKAFNAAMVHDTVIEPVAHTFRAFRDAGHTVIIVSGRSDDNRAVTEQWLKDNDLDGYAKLYMRAEKDYRSDDIVKHEILSEIRNNFGEPDMVFDDRPRVVKMWRDNHGIYVFDCNQTGEDF